MDPVRTLLSGIVDYAGLFPPTSATMEDAVAEYARQRQAADSWMLSAFVVPVSRLEEFGAAAAGPMEEAKGPWPLSVLVGADYESELGALGAWIRGLEPGTFGVAAIEHRPAAPDRIADVAAKAAGAELFLELPWDADLRPWIDAVAAAGARAKIRCGGVTPDLIPPVDRVAEFLRVCDATGVGLKFTAGLHHPVRSEQALTYEDDAPRAMMHGFLNVFVAASLLARGGLSDLDLLAVLEETDPDAFRVGPDTVGWRDQSVPLSEVASARDGFARSFGSCSFAEPVEDLQHLGML